MQVRREEPSLTLAEQAVTRNSNQESKSPMPRRKNNAATATTPTPLSLSVVSPPDALDPPYAGETRVVEYDADVLEDAEPAPELAPATVMAPATAPVIAPTRATPRKVSAEVVKAETRLINMERAAQASLVACEQRWADKRRELIQGLPADVQAMLLAGGVIDEDDCGGEA